MKASVMRERFETALPSGVDAPGIARRLLTEWFAPVLADGTLMTARLLASELVTSAVTHGRGRITLKAQWFENRLMVEVIDEGPGFEREPREHDSQIPEVGGWGLSIVDAESSRWGISRDNSHVWFELERPRPRLQSQATDD